MRNMSNMFYDYLSEKIIKYFQTNIPDPGEKYYIQFENDEQVGELYSVLENNIISSSFITISFVARSMVLMSWISAKYN